MQDLPRTPNSSFAPLLLNRMERLGVGDSLAHQEQHTKRRVAGGDVSQICPFCELAMAGSPHIHIFKQQKTLVNIHLEIS